ncbi:antibiotic biosynthesis monooxygenase family protein [Chelativorans sp. YIM 93263]|uniref:antibiotic biosynthesis monooxygenase family protein n=1 Tax=Chelativorans sp. YIM 93263 TaxID=2906648 RepID=UPI0023797A09|nr:antibiotic biosynthesis monooxygenase family protein [Chelativorans sp. YIM 93263]
MTVHISKAGAEIENALAPTPAVLINTFVAKPGKLDAFLAVQAAELSRLTEQSPPAGWRGSRLHRSLDDDKAVMVTVFDTVEDHQRWLRTDEFLNHVKIIEDFLEDGSPGYYEIVASAGHL